MKPLIFYTLLFSALLCLASASQAEAFRWVDDEGKIRIGIKPAAEPKNIIIESNQQHSAKTGKSPSVVAKPAERKVFLNTPDITLKVTAPIVKATPAPVVAAPKMPTPVKAAVLAKPPKITKKSAPKKSQVAKISTKKPIAKKKIVKKKMKPKTVEKPKNRTPLKTTTAKADIKRNQEMCGVYSGYVTDYKEKVRSCSASLCDIYKRSLARYQKKQNSYCG